MAPGPRRRNLLRRKRYAAMSRTDVLILGAGIAGTSCALRAAEGGARVLVLEQSASWSGRGGNIGVANSAFMQAQGYQNDPAQLAREWISDAETAVMNALSGAIYGNRPVRWTG